MKIRKIYISVIVLLITVFGITDSYSQTHYRSRLFIGAKGGVDLSRIFFNPSVSQVLKPGAEVGLMFRYVEESNFGLITELNFMQRGWKESFEKTDYSYQRTLDYLQIPVLAHIYFGRRGKFFINIGPEIGFRMSDRVKCNFNTKDISSLPNFPIHHQTMQYSEDVRQRIDYGICGGIGGEFGITPKHSLEMEVRFYYGLGNLFGSSRKDNFNASNSMALEFTLGYWFRIK